MTSSEAARLYIGQRELHNNVFKDDTEFGRKLHAAGQCDGNPWCALAAEVWFKDAYPREVFPDFWAKLDRLFSASAVRTFRNFKKAGYMPLTKPEVDCLVIWQKFKKGMPFPSEDWPQGHAGVVSQAFASDAFRSIEGNTDGSGGREGVEVAERAHNGDDNAYEVNDGMRLLGFIQIRP